MSSLLKKCQRIAEDIYVDVMNNLFLKGNLKVNSCDALSSLKIISQERKSIIRWGDGEGFVLMGANIHFQESTPALRRKLLEVIREYNDESPYFMCLPDKFIKCTTNELKKIKSHKGDFYQLHKRTRYIYSKYFDKNSQYLSHYVFKFGANKYFNNLRNVFMKYDNYVVIKSGHNIVKKFFEKLDIDSKYEVVVIPDNNAFQVYDEIYNEIIHAVAKIKTGDDNTLILISAGPCAKVLVHDLAKRGYVAYDIGKLFENTLNY